MSVPPWRTKGAEVPARRKPPWTPFPPWLCARQRDAQTLATSVGNSAAAVKPSKALPEQNGYGPQVKPAGSVLAVFCRNPQEPPQRARLQPSADDGKNMELPPRKRKREQSDIDIINEYLHRSAAGEQTISAARHDALVNTSEAHLAPEPMPEPMPVSTENENTTSTPSSNQPVPTGESLYVPW